MVEKKNTLMASGDTFISNLCILPSAPYPKKSPRRVTILGKLSEVGLLTVILIIPAPNQGMVLHYNTY
jgi:hypothetical protein